MFIKKHLFPGISSALTMFLLSFSWHGILLNDFKKISYPIEIFLVFLGLLYLLLGFLMSLGLSYVQLKKHPVFKGLGIGIVSGLLIFLVVFVLGVSLSGKNLHPLHASIDFIWQIIEQSAGGVCAALVFARFEKREMMFK